LTTRQADSVPKDAKCALSNSSVTFELKKYVGLQRYYTFFEMK